MEEPVRLGVSRQAVLNNPIRHQTMNSLPLCSSGPEMSLANTYLYTGYKKQDYLHTVWKITSEAINELHRSLESRPGEEAEAEDPAGLKVSQGRLGQGVLAVPRAPRKRPL